MAKRSKVADKQATRSHPAPARRPLYEPLDWTLVRAPLLPVETYLALSKPPSEHGAGKEAAGPWTFQNGSLVPRDPHVRRAIAVGSSDLLNGLKRSKPTGPNGTELKGKLLRYLIRMSTRPTPYGLFAGVALAEWGQTTSLALADRPPRTRTRPDMEWLLKFVLELEAMPEVREGLRFFSNSAAFVHAGRVFLSERVPGGESDAPSTVSLRATGVVLRALAAARKPIAYRDLLSELLSQTPGRPRRRSRALLVGCGSKPCCSPICAHR
jgi:lantibiotic biosynthesis protein